MPIQTLGLSPPEKRSTPFDNPAVPLGSPLAWEFLSGGGRSDSAEIVTPSTAMAQATVNACVRLLSESIASLSLLLYTRSGNGKVEALDNPLHRLLAVEPNSDSTAFSMWDSFVASIALTGNGYLEIQRTGVGEIVGLWFLPPSAVSPERQLDGSLAYRVSQGTPPLVKSRLLPAKSVIHVPWHSTDGVTGVSVIAQARNAIGNSIAMGKFGGRFFANNATPSGVLSTNLKVKPEDVPKMRADWESQQAGTNLHRIAVLGADLKYTPISLSNADSQWLESQKFSREQIAGLFKLHPSMLGDTSRVAGETYAGQQLGFLTLTLRPWLNRIEQELTRKLLGGLPQYSISHDVSDLLRLDIKSQMEALKSSIQSGIMTPNEARLELGLNPGPASCDVYLTPVNMMNSERLLVAPKPTVVEGTENV